MIRKLLDRFEVGRLEVGIRHFCGKQFDREEQDILIDVADNTTRATYIDVGKSRKVEEKITPGEENITQCSGRGWCPSMSGRNAICIVQSHLSYRFVTCRTG